MTPLTSSNSNMSPISTYIGSVSAEGDSSRGNQMLVCGDCPNLFREITHLTKTIDPSMMKTMDKIILI
jgi:hypothetical protein